MAGHASQMGKGGMISKIDAAEICFKNKCEWLSLLVKIKSLLEVLLRELKQHGL